MITAIYGGSFNPIHTGHTALGCWLVENGYVDELWFLVSPQNPLKRSANLLDDDARLHLARLAVDDTPMLKVSDFEFHMPRPSYMVYTLEALRENYPTREFVLVIGADNWLRFHQWFHADDILRNHRIIIYPRPGYPISDVPSSITVVNAPLFDISSTEIRYFIANNPSYDGFGLNPRVWAEIKAKGYYR